MYHLDTKTRPGKWIFEHGWDFSVKTDAEVAKILGISTRTAARWRADIQRAPRYAIDYLAAIVLQHIVPEHWQKRGLRFYGDNSMAFTGQGNYITLSCLENCDYLAGISRHRAPYSCEKHQRHQCKGQTTQQPAQALLFAQHGQPMWSPPSN